MLTKTLATYKFIIVSILMRKIMYKPLQIPFILNPEFFNSVLYTEEAIDSLSDFVICFWEMLPKKQDKTTVENIIITDACIDIVVGFDDKQIGFAGMTKTDFHHTQNISSSFFGVRMKPGVFQLLAEISASKLMDTYLPLNQIYHNFDLEYFFNLPYIQAKEVFKDFLFTIFKNKKADTYTKLFDELNDSFPLSPADVYEKLHFSPRQCQRLFAKHYGISIQLAISILRFQKCLNALVNEHLSPTEVLAITNYYDQSHFIKDFKRNIGITPFELLRKYK